MSAIDALTTKYDSNLLSSISNTSNKKNINIDFNQLLVAAMQPGLPGVENAQSSQEMLQVSMIQQMQELSAKIDNLATALSGSTTSEGV